MSFNKHFVFHNLNMMSKRINEETISEDSLNPIFTTLNRIQFSHLESEDAKRLLDSIDFKISPNLSNKISENHVNNFNQIANSIIGSNESFMDDLLVESKKMNKSDSFSKLFVDRVNASFEVNLLNNESLTTKQARRPSMSM